MWQWTMSSLSDRSVSSLARSLSSRALQPARRVKRHQRLNNVKTVSFKPSPELPSSRQSPFLYLLKPETGKKDGQDSFVHLL